MWLDREVVHVRDPQRRGLRVVAADAVLRVELRSYRLLITKCDLVNRKADVLSRSIARIGDELVPAGLLAELYRAGDLAAGIGQLCGGRRTYAGGPAEIDCRTGDTISRGVVHLYHDWLIQQHSGITNLLPTAGFNDRCSGSGGLQRRWLVALAGASSHQ